MTALLLLHRAHWLLLPSKCNHNLHAITFEEPKVAKKDQSPDSTRTDSSIVNPEPQFL